jgi:NAD(P)-dependent dehydrogenase (short-subunit alcohol dehydrogenase family)
MEIKLTGKRALVTGANSGIGEVIALALADAGAKVAVNYVVNPEAAQAVAAKVRDTSGDALALEADVGNAEQVAQMFDAIDAAWGGLDVLVNNAGIDGPRAYGWESDATAWHRVIEINLLGAFYCSREALRRMVAQKRGVVLNLTSVHEVIPWSGYSAYAAAKAGASMLTRTLAQETAPHGVRVLAIAPGAIQTPINQAVWSDPQGLADLVRKIPMGRLGQREEIAKMATFLVSDAASYVTGTTVFVDGGMTDYADFAHGG